MLVHRYLFAALFLVASSPVLAVEGPTAAGPIGSTDVRSALVPPAGLYFGIIGGGAQSLEFLDGNGDEIPALADAELSKYVGGPFFLYVPEIKVLGGSIAILGDVPFGRQCSRIFVGQVRRCESGVGDPYAEISWGRSFGHLRASRDPGAYPIFEGLAIVAGVGVVFPIGKYDANDQKLGLSIGNNIWDVAPTIGFTYTSAPVLADGTEISARLYWNNYGKNDITQYQTGDTLSLDYAVTEHIGRFQVGVAGTYFVQVEDDTIQGVKFAPDGLRAEILQAGGIVAYDMPELNAALKLKANTTIFAKNTVSFTSIVIGLYGKF